MGTSGVPPPARSPFRSPLRSRFAVLIAVLPHMPTILSTLRGRSLGRRLFGVFAVTLFIALAGSGYGACRSPAWRSARSNWSTSRS